MLVHAYGALACALACETSMVWKMLRVEQGLRPCIQATLYIAGFCP